MENNYNRNYTENEVEDILKIVHSCIKKEKYSISLNKNREENSEFIMSYGLTSDKIKKILLNITIFDFCYSLNNYKTGFEHEVLYVFAPQVYLYTLDGTEEQINIYIKINILEISRDYRLIVISFHKCNKEIDYLFRK